MPCLHSDSDLIAETCSPLYTYNCQVAPREKSTTAFIFGKSCKTFKTFCLAQARPMPSRSCRSL